MNIFSVVIILLLLLAGAVGFKRGVLKELVVFLGTLLVYVIAFNLKDPLANFLMKVMPFFDFIGSLHGLIVLNVLIYQVLSFAIITSILFVIFNIIVSVTGVFQKIVDLTIILTLPSKILGFVVGLLSGYLFIFIALIIFAIPLGGVEQFNSSKVVNHILHKSPVLSNSLGGFKSAVADIYTLTDKTITDKETNTNKLNLEALDIMLKYKVVKVENIKYLVEETDKLDSIKGIDAVVYKYKIKENLND